MLLGQLQTVPLLQPLLGHVIRKCEQKPPQSACAIQTLGSLFLNHLHISHLKQIVIHLEQKVRMFMFGGLFLYNNESYSLFSEMVPHLYNIIII